MSNSLSSIAGIKAYSHDQLVDLFDSLGQPSFRVDQLESWIYAKHVSSYDEMTNLPKTLRSSLSRDYPLYVPTIVEKSRSKDGTAKYLVEYSDGTMVETVGIPSGNRLTVCFSTQAGCRMACAFCATGKNGFIRNLAPGEIYDQVAIVSEDFGQRVTNVVGMGQGEPFSNYDSVLAAVRFLNSSNGADIGARHITISTSGIIPNIYKFSKEPEQFTLAVSLHSAIQTTRDKLMPKVSKYSLKNLHAALKSYSDATNRRPTLEYSMIENVNDSDEDLRALIAFCDGLLVHVNLIPLNKIDGSDFQSSGPKKVRHFADSLNANGIEASVRKSRGSDIHGACGQLIQRHADSNLVN